MSWVLIWVICATAGAVIGGARGRPVFGFIAGLFLGPIGVLCAFFFRGHRRDCPHCRELVHDQATICPHCRKDLPPVASGYVHNKTASYSDPFYK